MDTKWLLCPSLSFSFILMDLLNLRDHFCKLKKPFALNHDVFTFEFFFQKGVNFKNNYQNGVLLKIITKMVYKSINLMKIGIIRWKSKPHALTIGALYSAQAAAASCSSTHAEAAGTPPWFKVWFLGFPLVRDFHDFLVWFLLFIIVFFCSWISNAIFFQFWCLYMMFVSWFCYLMFVIWICFIIVIFCFFPFLNFLFFQVWCLLSDVCILILL